MRESPAFFSSTARIIFSLVLSIPTEVLLAKPTFAGLTRLWTSNISGRLPSYTAAVTEPSSSSSLFSRKVAETSVTSVSPADSIRNAPISLVVPKRFLYARRILSSPSRSPLKFSTQSTRCSTVFGPAKSPLLVTCATIKIAQLRVLPSFISWFPHILTCDTLPGAESSWLLYNVWIESIIRKSGFILSNTVSTFSILVSDIT